MADITPVTREEFYLAKAGGQDVPVPSAVTREEHYLERLSNDSVVVPSPVTRREKFLYFACGGEIDLPSEEKMTRLERLIAKAGGMDVATPTAVTRLEKFWAKVEGGGWEVTELTGTLPMTFRSNGTALINYKIYGTSEGAGVQTESEEPPGYKLPILCQSGNLWNGEIEQGSVSNGGSLVESAKRVRSCITNLVGGQTYFIKSNQNIRMIYAYYGRWTDTKIGLVLDNNTHKTEYIFKLPEGANSIGIALMTHSETNIVPSDVTTAILANSSSYDLFIGFTKLGEAEYVDYGEQKIYRRILLMTYDDKHFITKDNKDFCLRRTGYNG